MIKPPGFDPIRGNEVKGPGAIDSRAPADRAARAPAPSSEIPLGVFGRTPRAAASDANALLAAMTVDRGRGPEIDHRKAWNALIDGQEPKLPSDVLRQLQALALDTAQRLFTNEFGDDDRLKHQVGLKQPAFSSERLPEADGRAVLAKRELADKMCDALNVIVRTFRGTDESDTALRRAAMQKLGRVGRQRDIAAILPFVRKGNSSDLYHGLHAIRDITSRVGSPQARGRLASHPIAGPLLKKERLTDAERTQLQELVLQHGQVSHVKRLSHGSNMNEVFFVTFAEKVRGPDGTLQTVRGVFKPERTWPGKDRAYFSREVSAYEFDRAFAKTGMVPPTVEALLPLSEGKTCELGSMQLMIEPSRPLGFRKRENGVEHWHYQPDLLELVESAGFKEQLARAKVLLYVLGDPDKLASNVKPLPNLANFMIDEACKIWLIDNSYSQGAAPKPDRNILPKYTDEHIVASLGGSDPEAVKDAMSQYIEAHDASEVARRAGVAAQEMEKRPKKAR